MKDIEFIDAQLAFSKGDARKLAAFARRHILTADQLEFIAAALLGEIKQIDGRRHKPGSDEMVRTYENVRRHYGRLADALPRGLVEVNPHARRLLKLWRDPDAAICKMLAEKYGIAPASVRRTIERALRRRTKRTS